MCLGEETIHSTSSTHCARLGFMKQTTHGQQAGLQCNQCNPTSHNTLGQRSLPPTTFTGNLQRRFKASFHVLRRQRHACNFHSWTGTAAGRFCFFFKHANISRVTCFVFQECWSLLVEKVSHDMSDDSICELSAWPLLKNSCPALKEGAVKTRM